MTSQAIWKQEYIIDTLNESRTWRRGDPGSQELTSSSINHSIQISIMFINPYAPRMEYESQHRTHQCPIYVRKYIPYMEPIFVYPTSSKIMCLLSSIQISRTYSIIFMNISKPHETMGPAWQLACLACLAWRTAAKGSISRVACSAGRHPAKPRHGAAPGEAVYSARRNSVRRFGNADCGFMVDMYMYIYIIIYNHL